MTITQLYQRGVQLAQTGWMCETMGNPLGAGQSYQAALQALEACGRLPGVQPLDRLYWMGCCQLRLGWLTYMAGNPVWAQGWFNLAQANLAKVCQLDPNNAAYQGLLRQVQQGQSGPDAKGEGSSPWLGLLKKGLGMLPDLIEMFKGANNGQAASGWMGGMGNCADAGWGDWMGGGWNGGNWGGYGY